VLEDLPYAPTATMDIILTLVRPTATTDLTGSPVACLLAPARGTAGDVLGVGVAGVGEAAGAAEAGAVEAGMAEAGVVEVGVDADLLVVSGAADFVVEMGSTVTPVEVSVVAVDSTDPRAAASMAVAVSTEVAEVASTVAVVVTAAAAAGSSVALLQN